VSCRLFGDGVSNAQILQHEIRWEDAQEWYESDRRKMACLRKVSQHLPGQTAENHRKIL
jgi:hypothetical protein